MPSLLSLALALSLGAAQAAAPRFIVDTKDGALPAAELRKLGTGWLLQRDGADSTLAPTDWLSLQQQGKHRSAPAGPPFVLLGGGGRLPLSTAQPPRLHDSRLHFTPAGPLRPAMGTELSLYRPYVALLLLSVPDGVDEFESWLGKLEHERRDHDLVLLRNGDRIEGAVSRLTAEGCELLADGQKVVTPLPKLAGIAFATTSLARPRPKKLHALAVLDGGTRLPLTSLRLDPLERRWLGRAVLGEEVVFPEAALTALDLVHGRAQYLTELTPTSYQHTPYLGLTWPADFDAGAAGRTLRVGADYYDKGVSLHSRSRISYRLDGHYSWFESMVGIAPSAPKGRARVTVLIDGRRHALADGKELTADAAPLSVRLDVRSARTLTLAVDYGSLGDVQARVNWGGARLVRSK